MLTFHEGSLNLANYFCTFHGRCANFNVTVGVNEKNVAELYSVALFNLVAEKMNIQIFACLGFELLSFDFYNCVHFLFFVFVQVRPCGGPPLIVIGQPLNQAFRKLAHKITHFFPNRQTFIGFFTPIRAVFSYFSFGYVISFMPDVP